MSLPSMNVSNRLRLTIVMITIKFTIVANCAPLMMIVGYDQYRNPIVMQGDDNTKMIWSIPELISSINWLPIEINVPDTVTNIGNGISNIIQMIPVINRFNTQQRPRPYTLLRYPEDVGNRLKEYNRNEFKTVFNPFDDYQTGLPAYP